MSCEERESSPQRNADNLHSITPQSDSINVVNNSNSRHLVENILASKMFFYGREIIFFFLAITFTALAALHSSPPKISKPPVAKPFFNQSSIVLDFYKGHLGAMIERITDADISFVMYYAPWDAESQTVRDEFEKVAEHFHSEIFFAAINCWHPNSECRLQYNKIQSYPVLLLYPSRDQGIQYRGIRTVPYMARFLNAFMNPIVRLTRKEQVVNLLTVYNTAVIGFFNFTQLSKSPGYREFYRTAIQSLERDPNREIIFAVATSVMFSKAYYGVTKFPSAKLLLWNETLNYPKENSWTTDGLSSWITSSIKQPILWLQPPGIKSLTLAPFLRGGPVLFLFTPRNPLHQENYNYNLIKEVGLSYYNCDNNPLINEIIASLKYNRRTALTRHSEKTKQCIKILRKNKNKSNASPLNISIQQWINNSCCANIVMNKCVSRNKRVISSLKDGVSMCNSVSEKFTDVCKNADVLNIFKIPDKKDRHKLCYDSKDQVNIEQYKSFKLKSFEHTTRVFRQTEDLQSSSAVRQFFSKKICKKWLMGNSYHQPIFPQSSSNDSNITLTKLVCKTNKTLALIVIDSLHYFHFAEGLGIDVLTKKHQTATVILDAAQESQYVMNEEYSRDSLIRFINDYTNGVLQRNMRSNNSRLLANNANVIDKCTLKDSSKACVPELTTETFLDAILNPTKDVVVMYHSPYCAFCSAISYVYLSVARYLSEMDHLLFARVDGDNNDLPWEYNMNRFPSILFFPAERKEDSTVYPFSLPITITNLLNFVLANLNADSHIEALINICQSGIGDPPHKCIVTIRWLCLDIIEQLLREYRKLRRHLAFLHRKLARNRRKIILLKLEHFKDVHLILGSTVNLGKDCYKVQLIRRKFKKYYELLKLIEFDSTINANNEENLNIAKDIRIKNNIKDEL